MLKPRAQMTLENASSFQYMIYHKLLVETNLALKKIEGPQSFNTWGQNGL